MSETGVPGHMAAVAGQGRDEISTAVLRTLLYADVFGYPLTLEELHRYLIGLAATRRQVATALQSPHLCPWLVSEPPYYALAAGGLHFDRRRQRQQASGALWLTARRYARRLATLPFVRMVAVTGSLAVDNPQAVADDLDYAIVTAPGRTWLVRVLAIALVRLARLRRVHLCPNYIMDSDHLLMADHTLFTAHELTQMVPCYGLDMHARLLAVNAWAWAYLPNAADVNVTCQIELTGAQRRLKRLAEWLLGGWLGDLLERREREHKIRQLSSEAVETGTLAACFSEGVCKGHMNDYGRRIQLAYEERLSAAGLRPHEPPATGG